MEKVLESIFSFKLQLDKSKLGFQKLNPDILIYGPALKQNVTSCFGVHSPPILPYLAYFL